MNLIIATAFVFKLWAVADVPPEYAWYTYEAAVEAEIDPDDLAALLIAENRGHYPTDLVESHSGASGLFQTTPMWAERIGYEQKDVFHPRVSSEVAASIVVYTTEDSHPKCSGDHHWTAHWFCARRSRDRCHKPVKRFKRILRELEADDRS